MPPVYYHHKETNELEEITIQGTPLGAMKNAKYKIEERKLKSGDEIMFDVYKFIFLLERQLPTGDTGRRLPEE